MQPDELRTARLLLRPLRATDIDALYEIQGNRAYMRHTFAAESREASAEWLERYERSRAVHGFAPWTVVRGTDVRVIGWGGLGIDPLASKWGVEVSYFMHPEIAGYGYATELVRAALNTGFDVHRFERIAAFARAENAASIRVLMKCGFTFVRFEPELDRNRYELTRNQRREIQP